MSSQKKVAIITGGASGMGYAVAQELYRRGDWIINLLDLNGTGNEAAKELGATFHQVDVTNYQELAAAFKTIFQANRRIDFVHANAGIMDKENYYATHDTGDDPPPQPSSLVLDINVTAVMYTSYLAQHYFRQTPDDGTGPRSLVITASCGGFYQCPASPVYGSSKFGALGFARNIAGSMWQNDGVRVNAICPGTVRTNLLPEEFWKKFPEEYFCPIEKIVEVVMMLVDDDRKQANGAGGGQPLVGQSVEISGTKHYFRTQVDYCDDAMAAVMGSAGVQAGS